MELFIAIVILAIVISAIYVGFSGTVKVAQEVEGQINLESSFRVFAERIIDDVESLISISNVGFFLNVQSNSKLYFVTEDMREKKEGTVLSMISDPFCPIGEEFPRKGPTLISYEIVKDSKNNNYFLKRKAIPLSRNFKDRDDIILTDIKDIEVHLLDKEGQLRYEWNTLESSAELPKMVVVNITLDGTPWGCGDLIRTLYVTPFGIKS